MNRGAPAPSGVVSRKTLVRTPLAVVSLITSVYPVPELHVRISDDTSALVVISVAAGFKWAVRVRCGWLSFGSIATVVAGRLVDEGVNGLAPSAYLTRFGMPSLAGVARSAAWPVFAVVPKQTSLQSVCGCKRRSKSAAGSRA